MYPRTDNPLSFPNSTNSIFYLGLHANPHSAISMAIIANTPQLFLPKIYFLYNDLLTGMVLATEYNDYGNERKALRVSKPHGVQRSIYYFSMLCLYIVPLLLTSAVLHCLISQSSYYVRVVSYDQWGSVRDIISTCGFSVVAMIILLPLGGLMLCTAAVLGLKRLQTTMPVAKSYSKAISASCHPLKNDIDAAIKPVMWGEVSGKCNNSMREEPGKSKDERSFCRSEAAVLHCNFNSLDVISPSPDRSLPWS